MFIQVMKRMSILLTKMFLKSCLILILNLCNVKLVLTHVLSKDMKSREMSLREMNSDFSHALKEIYLYRFLKDKYLI